MGFVAVGAAVGAHAIQTWDLDLALALPLSGLAGAVVAVVVGLLGVSGVVLAVLIVGDFRTAFFTDYGQAQSPGGPNLVHTDHSSRCGKASARRVSSSWA